MRYISISNELHFLSPRNKYSSTVAQEAKTIYKKQLSQAYKKTGRKPIISLD